MVSYTSTSSITSPPRKELHLSSLVHSKLNQESLRRSPNIARMVLHINLLLDLEARSAQSPLPNNLTTDAESDASDSSDEEDNAVPFEVDDLAKLIRCNTATRQADLASQSTQPQFLDTVLDKLFPPDQDEHTQTTVQEIEVEDDDDW